MSYFSLSYLPIQAQRQLGALAQEKVQAHSALLGLSQAPLGVSHAFSHRFSPDSGSANVTDISGAGSHVLTSSRSLV